MKEVQHYIQENKERFLEELLDMLRIPSISADPAYTEDVKRNAEFVAESLRKAGADTVEVCPTEGHPIVFARKDS